MSFSLDARLVHGAVVHFPIVLAILAAVLGVWRARWAHEIYVVAARATAATGLLAAASGWWLGSQFSVSAPLLHHREAALVAAALSLATAAVATPKRSTLSRLLSLLTVVAVVVAAHRGGAFAHPGAVETVAADDEGPLPMAGATVDFNRDVAPIFERACLECHSPQRARGGLLLTTRAQMLRGGRHGPAVVPGDAEASLLVRRLHAEGKERMPQDATLPGGDIALITKWIVEGASTRSLVEEGQRFAAVDANNRDRGKAHWAFQPPRRPTVPPATTWSANPIDGFVFSSLQAAGHSPRARAPVEVRLRRATLALVGRGPTPEELAAARAGMPWPQLIDGLLASPEYGLTQASRWFDLARYADTFGAGSIQGRSVRPWGLWVINSLNDNLPFDRFVQLQLAADLLEGHKSENLVATGFLQLGALSLEAGTDPEANHYNAVVDKVSTVGNAFFGMTFGCAACHDHKYDPISQKDFYQLYSIFNDATNETEVVGIDLLYVGKLVSLPSNTIGPAKPGEVVSPVAVFEGFRPSHIAKRGDYRALGPQVEPNVPAVFSGFPAKEGDRPDRAAFARWVTSRNNPFFARVTVNRLWEARFGRGLVATPEDFGVRAEAPTHPKLLDWLVVEFIESHYNLKYIEKLIATSETFQQRADGNEGVGGPVVAAADDPVNEALGRGPRVRLDAEVVRDAVLAAAGVSSMRPGAPNMRSVFLAVRRGAVNPALAAFDMPERDVSCAVRTRSTAPQQSLALLNAPEFVGAAKQLAEIAVSTERTTAARAQLLYRRLLGRDAREHEIAAIADFLRREGKRETTPVGGKGDAHRWLQVTQALFAQDELVVPL